jgi:hypothetical protein
MMFQQGCGRNVGEFGELRAYLIAKLLWDPGADTDALMKDFLAGYYGAAADYIGKYIGLMHDSLEESGEPLWIYGNPWQPCEGYLSPGLIRQYNWLFDQAEAFTASDPETLMRVRIARLPLDYAILEQGKRYGTGAGGYFERMEGKWRVLPDMRLRLHRFTERCKQAGIKRLNEKGLTPEEYRESIAEIFDSGLVEHKAFDKKVELRFPASHRYPAGGPAALTNGLRGGADHYCNWLGFEGTDMEAVIDLERSETITRVSVDFMQDARSWIFLPEKVIVSVSEDGAAFVEAAVITNVEPLETGGVIKRTFAADLPKIAARYVRVHAVNIKACPGWHRGAGGKAWIFADEIIVE